MTKISTVVPIFHAHARITEALESIRLQTHPLDELETIIVCDASNDLCVRMGRAFLQQHGMRGTVLALDGIYGCASTMLNRGWQAASGDWIQFLDSDDILAPNKFEMQTSQTSRPCDVICSSWQTLCLSGSMWQPVGGVKTPRFTEPVILKIVSLQSSVLGPALFFRKSLEAVGGISYMVSHLTSGHLMLKLWSNGGRFVEAPSPSPLYFVRATATAKVNPPSVDLARQHLQNVVVAEAMLRQQKSGALSRQDTKEIGRLCDESLSVLYGNDWAAFQQYWQWLREVDPRYAPRHSTKLKFVTLLLGYENAAALASFHHWIKSSFGRAMTSVFGSLHLKRELPRLATNVTFPPNLSMGRPRFSGVALFALIAGFASLAAILALGQFGGDAYSSVHSRLDDVPRRHTSLAPSQRSSRISAANEWRSDDAPVVTSPTASLTGPKSHRADTISSFAETIAPSKEAASTSARETIALATPTAATTRATLSAVPTENQQLALSPVERTSTAATSADTESLTARTAAPNDPQTGAGPIASEVPFVPHIKADLPNLTSLPAPALVGAGSTKTPQSATGSFSPDTPALLDKPDGKDLETAPGGMAKPNTVAVIAHEAPSATLNPIELPANNASKAVEHGKDLETAPRGMAKPNTVAVIAHEAPSATLNPIELPANNASKAVEHGVEASAPTPRLTLLEREEAEKMLARGERDLANGNVVMARQFFLRTAIIGHARGAMLLATTYDPTELARLGVVGLQPNSVTARKWYERARELGAAEAAERLARLPAD